MVHGSSGVTKCNSPALILPKNSGGSLATIGANIGEASAKIGLKLG